MALDVSPAFAVLDDDVDGNGLEERMPGSSHFTAERLESILQAEGTTGTLPLSKEGLFVLSIATEEFIRRLARHAHTHPDVEYVDMASTVHEHQEFRFLKDIIPQPVSLKDALTRREQKLSIDILHDDSQLTLPRSAMPPSLQQLIQHPGSYHYQIPPSALAAAASTSAGVPPPSKGKGRMTNGKPKLPPNSTANGHNISHFSTVLDLQHAIPPPPTLVHGNGYHPPPPSSSSTPHVSAPTASHAIPPPPSPSQLNHHQDSNKNNVLRIPSPWEAASLSYNELKSLESLANDLRRAAVAEAAAASTTTTTAATSTASTTPPHPVPSSSSSDMVVDSQHPSDPPPQS